jgi:hypothetical protein
MVSRRSAPPFSQFDPLSRPAERDLLPVVTLLTTTASTVWQFSYCFPREAVRAVPTYIVDPDDYYRRADHNSDVPASDIFCGADEVQLTRSAINGLIDRYGLAGKAILSLGSGRAFEEYWFHMRGCRLTLNDLDEVDHGVEGYLKTLVPSDREEFIYYIEDADRTLARFPDGHFDALYVSGFHPDEVRREGIQENFRQTRTEEEAANYVTWPADAEPYADTLVNAPGKVKPGGIAIFQHYRGGVYLDNNPHYIESVRRQFRGHGAELLEAYAFRKSPCHILAIAYRGTTAEAETFAQDALNDRAEIRTFHGRYQDAAIKEDVVKVFDILNAEIDPNAAFADPAGSEIRETAETEDQPDSEHAALPGGTQAPDAAAISEAAPGIVERLVRLAASPARLYAALEWRIRAALSRRRD